MASKGVFPADLERELNQKYRCVRCGRHYVEIDNIGQLKCRQHYYIEGRLWSVAADHMPMDHEDAYCREPVSREQLKKNWLLYVYTDEGDDVVDIDSRYARSLRPVDARCVMRDTRHGEDLLDASVRESDVMTLGAHIQRAWVSGSESAPSAELMLGIAGALDDSSDEDDDFGLVDDEDDGKHEPSRSLRIVRYDLAAYENLRTRVWPKVIAHNAARKGAANFGRFELHETTLWQDKRVVARAYGLGHEDWLRGAPRELWHLGR